jgi:hypothetical protein
MAKQKLSLYEFPNFFLIFDFLFFKSIHIQTKNIAGVYIYIYMVFFFPFCLTIANKKLIKKYLC